MTAPTLRTARIGDLVPSQLLGPRSARRLAASAVLQRGAGPVAAYLDDLNTRAADIAAWDGRVSVAAPDGGAEHRLLVVDRYRQVYAVADARDAGDLPGSAALVEWFRFLATACPECGVIDDPVRSGPTP